MRWLMRWMRILIKGWGDGYFLLRLAVVLCMVCDVFAYLLAY